MVLSPSTGGLRILPRSLIWMLVVLVDGRFCFKPGQMHLSYHRLILIELFFALKLSGVLKLEIALQISFYIHRCMPNMYRTLTEMSLVKNCSRAVSCLPILTSGFFMNSEILKVK